MQKSMTGYGRGAVKKDGRDLTIELKSVNHRFLDISMRLPRTLTFADEAVRYCITDRLRRGHIEVFMKYENHRNDSKSVHMDESLLGAYLKACDEASKYSGIDNDVKLIELLRLPDVLKADENEDDQEQIVDMCKEACANALDQIIAMRELEGEKMAMDVLSNNSELTLLLDEIVEFSPKSIAVYKEKLSQKIEELIGNGAVVDSGRLEAEVALFCDKAAVDEEIARIRSHINQVELVLSKSEASGRKLEFIVQELNREFNTIGSKSNDLKITNNVIQAKSILEKIREQVQNIE